MITVAILNSSKERINKTKARVKALAQPEGESDENEKVPENEKPKKVAYPKDHERIKIVTIYTLITVGGAFVAWVEILRNAGLGQ